MSDLIYEGRFTEVHKLLKKEYPSLNFKRGSHDRTMYIWMHTPEDNHTLQFSEHETWEGEFYLKIDLFRINDEIISKHEGRYVRTMKELIDHINEFMKSRRMIR